MKQEDCNPTVDLSARVKALELALAASREQALRRGTRHRLFISLTYLVPVLAFAGWAVAQTEQPLEGPVRTIGDITQVTAPFQVVDAGGRILLSVADKLDVQAGTSIWHDGSAGAVAVISNGGKPLAAMFASTMGDGRFVAYDTGGRPRAFVEGTGGVSVRNEAEKQVAALVVTSDQKGKVGVYGAGEQSIIDLMESPSGAGVLTVYDKSRKQLITAGEREDGGYLLASSNAGARHTLLWSDGVEVQKESGDALVALRRDSGGAGRIWTTDAAAQKVVDIGIDAGGHGYLGVMSNDQFVAVLTRENGAGQIYTTDAAARKVVDIGSYGGGEGYLNVWSNDQTVASLTVGETGAGFLRLSNAQGIRGLEASGFPGSGRGNGGQLRVWNAAGNNVATLAATSVGKGQLMIGDDAGTTAELFADDTGGNLNLSNAARKETLLAVGGGEGGSSVILSNASGELIASLGSSAEGKGSLLIADGNRPAAELSADSSGAGGLVLRNAAGEMTVNATGDASGAGNIAVSNSSGDLAAILGASGDGKGVLQIVDKDSTVAKLTADSAGAGSMVLHDSDGRVAVDANGAGANVTAFWQGQLVAGMGATPDGKGRVAVYGKNGGLAQLTESKEGAGLLAVKNSRDIIVAGVSGNRDAGAVIVNDSSGKGIAELSATSYGEGQLAIWDRGGSGAWAVISRDANGGGGVVQVFNSGSLAGTLMAKESGNGFMQLVTAGGLPAVEAGVNGNGVGEVHAGPNMKCRPAGSLGLEVPDCLVGRP